MFNFKEAFTYLFKEKNWITKFSIIYIATILFSVPYSIYTLVQNSRLNQLGSLKTTSLSSSSYLNSTSADSTVALLFMCFVLVIIIPFSIVSYWYLYENLQAAIQKRQTKGIWENKFEDTLKKAAKYFVVNLVYGLFLGLIALLVIGVIFGVFCCVTTLLAGAGSGSSMTNTRDFSVLFGTGVVGASLVLACCLIIFAFILGLIAYIIIMPAIMRLVGTNTLNEGLKLGENWEISKKYFGTFFTICMITVVYAVIVGGISGVGTVISQSLYSSSAVLGILSVSGVQIVMAFLSVYFGYYVHTRLLGQAFRHIVKKEDSLKHVEIGE